MQLVKPLSLIAWNDRTSKVVIGMIVKQSPGIFSYYQSCVL